MRTTPKGDAKFQQRIALTNILNKTAKYLPVKVLREVLADCDIFLDQLEDGAFKNIIESNIIDGYKVDIYQTESYDYAYSIYTNTGKLVYDSDGNDASTFSTVQEARSSSVEAVDIQKDLDQEF